MITYGKIRRGAMSRSGTLTVLRSSSQAKSSCCIAWQGHTLSGGRKALGPGPRRPLHAAAERRRRRDDAVNLLSADGRH